MTLPPTVEEVAEPSVKFLLEAARYFEKRPTDGEDAAHWSNAFNAENCRKAASLIASLQAERDFARAERDIFLRDAAHLEARAEAAESERDALRTRVEEMGKALDLAVSRGCDHCADSIRRARVISGAFPARALKGDG